MRHLLRAIEGRRELRGRDKYVLAVYNLEGPDGAGKSGASRGVDRLFRGPVIVLTTRGRGRAHRGNRRL